MRKKLPVVLLVLAIAGGLGLTIALLTSTTGYPLDDAWIHLDYARSLSERLTFGYNPGEWENGSTAPLWSILIAVPFTLGVPPELAGKLVGLVSFGLLAFFVYRVGVQVSGPIGGSIAALLVAFDPWASVLAISGMEPVGAMAASCAAIDGLLRKRWLQTGIALAAAGLLRPELALLVPILAVSACKLQRRQWLALAGPPLLAGSAWMLYGLAVTGKALPNTFWVKTDFGLSVAQQLDALRALFLAGPPVAVAAAATLVLWGLYRMGRGKMLLLFLGPPAALLLFYLLALPLGMDRGPMAPGSVENVYFARYPLIVLPWIFLLVAVGGKEVFDLAGKLSGRVAVGAGALLVPAVLVLPFWQGHRGALSDAYRANCAEIEAVQVEMACRLNESLPKDAVVAVSDAGAARFYIDRRVIDLVGLNTHEIFTEKRSLEWLREQGLTHVVVWPHWHEALLRSNLFEFRFRSRTHVERPTMVAGNDLVLFDVRPRQP